MAIRFCTKCNSEVENAGGFCLLGHDLRLAPPVDSLSALRAEVNRTFDEARRELAEVMAPVAAVTGDTIVVPDVTSGPPAPPPAEAPPPPPSTQLRVEPANEPAAEVVRPGAVWAGLDEHAGIDPGDPIAEFSPAPRMDWGPSRARLRRPRSKRATAEH